MSDVQPITGDYERQLRLLVADGAGGFTNGTVASLLAMIDRLRSGGARTAITTVEQLNDVSVGAVLVDCGGQGDAWQRRTDVAGFPFARTGSDGFYSADALLDFAPLLLVYVPENGDAS